MCFFEFGWRCQDNSGWLQSMFFHVFFLRSDSNKQLTVGVQTPLHVAEMI